MFRINVRERLTQTNWPMKDNLCLNIMSSIFFWFMKRHRGTQAWDACQQKGNVDRIALTVYTESSLFNSFSPAWLTSSSSPSTRRGRASNGRTFWQQNLLAFDVASWAEMNRIMGESPNRVQLEFIPEPRTALKNKSSHRLELIN